MIEPCWLGVAGPNKLTGFYRTVLGVEVTVLPPGGLGSGWSFGLRCDVAAVTAAALHAGCELLENGWVRSPTGVLTRLVERDHPAGLPASGPGSVAWTELHSRQHDVDRAWLEAVGVASEPLPVAGQPYFLLCLGAHVNAGCTTAETMIGWLPWVRVLDAERAAAAVNEHGGTLLGAATSVDGVGEMVAARDPSGAHFGILRAAEGE